MRHSDHLHSSAWITLVLAAASLLVLPASARAAPMIDFDRADVAFGAVPVGSTSSPIPLRVMNTGTGVLTVFSFVTSGPHSADFAVSAPSTPTSIAPSSDVFLTITCSPSVLGARGATLTVVSNDPARPVANVALTCTGALPLGSACTSSSPCAGAGCVDDVCCDVACGGGVADCQACSVAAGGTADGTCSALTVSAAAAMICRPVAGTCDLAETCTARTPTCPDDVFAAAGAICDGFTSGPCDAPDVCTGSSAACPAAFLSGVLCRSSSSSCDPAESCDGASGACPADVGCPPPMDGGVDAATLVDAAWPDAAAPDGAAAMVDGAVGTDAGSPADAAMPPDGAASMVDGAAGTDAASPGDAAAVDDASAMVDGAVGTDAASPSDAAMARDGTTSTDATIAIDASAPASGAGCSCRLSRSRAPHVAWCLALAALALAPRARSRRSADRH